MKLCQMIYPSFFQAGGNIQMEFVQKFTDQTMTSVAKDDPWYQAFTRATDKHEVISCLLEHKTSKNLTKITFL